MPELRTQIIDGRPVVTAVEHDPGHINPPLTALNRTYLADQDKHRDTVNDTVRAVGGAVRQVMTQGGARREQKNLRPSPSVA